jgi:hypothetical protein
MKNRMEAHTEQHWMTPRDTNLIRDLRYLMRENQEAFWHRFGVSQPSGSRFEAGATIPLPLLMLLRLYLLRVVDDEDLQLAQTLSGKTAPAGKAGSAGHADQAEANGFQNDVIASSDTEFGAQIRHVKIHAGLGNVHDSANFPGSLAGR